MTSEHPARGESLEARVNYACVVAALAAADGDVSEAELKDLHGLCNQLGIPPHAVGGVSTFADHPEPTRIRDALVELRDSELRFTLVTDMVVLGIADGTYDMRERKQVRGLASVMGISEDQVLAIESFVLERAETQRRMEVLAQATADEIDLEQPTTLMGELAARFAAVGVPAAAVVGMSPVDDLGVLGLQAGLSHLGLGLGVAPGVGVAVGLGFGSFVGVRYMYRKVLALTMPPVED